MNKLTVDQAERAVGELTGDAAKVASLVATCLNAEAAFHMLGIKAPTSPRKRKGFLLVGVQTLVEIEDLLATMPDEVALVKASMAFACDFCGMPAEHGHDDGWFCEACCAPSRHSPDPCPGETPQPLTP